MEKIWDVPEFDEDTTGDEALELIEQFSKDTHKLADHPYNNREHRQHNDFLEFREKLYQTAYPPETVEEVAGEEEEAGQEALRAEAEEEAELLEGFGYDPTEIPDDVQPFQVRALKEQRLCAEGGYAELGLMLEADLASLERSGSMPPGKISAVRELIRTEGVDPALKGKVDAIANDIIALIYEAKKRSRPI